MELTTLTGTGTALARDVSLLAPVGCRRTAPVMDTRSQGGVGSTGVRLPWQPQFSTTDPMFYAPKDFSDITTRLGPPICSPPA